MSKSGKLKKTAKAHQQKQQSATVKKGSKKNILIGIAVVAVILITVLLVWDKFHRIQVLKIGDETVYRDEIIYYIYQKESANSYLDQMYEQLTGAGYWESASSADAARTNSEVELDYLRAQVVQDDILAQEAKKAGIELTEEEQKEATENAEEFLSQLSEQEKSENVIRRKNIVALCEKIALAEKCKEKIVEKYGITEDSIREELDYEEYRQYDVQYYYISYQTVDEEGNVTDVDETELTKRTNDLLALKERAEAGEDFATLLPEEEEEESEEDDEQDTVEFSGEEPEGVTRAECDYSENVADMIFAMKNDEISDVIRDEESGMLYLFKMIQNDNPEYYEEEVESQLEDQKNQRFAQEYDSDIFPQYYVTYRENVWEEFDLGYTFSFAEDEEEEALSEEETAEE